MQSVGILRRMPVRAGSGASKRGAASVSLPATARDGHRDRPRQAGRGPATPPRDRCASAPRARGIAALCVAALSAACASAPSGKPDLLAFLLDGRTPRDQVFLALGTPNAQYESGRILAYRLGKDRGGYYPYEGHSWSPVSFSLILVFDDKDVLARHALVQVHTQ